MSKADDLPFSLTLEVRDACLCLHVRRAARTMARRYDEALRPVNLTSGQFSLLMSLNRPHPPTMGDVASLLALDRTTLTANLKPLVRRGLVEMSADEADKRSRRMTLTSAGRDVLIAAMPYWYAAQDATAQLLQDRDAEHLCADLRKLS